LLTRAFEQRNRQGDGRTAKTAERMQLGHYSSSISRGPAIRAFAGPLVQTDSERMGFSSAISPLRSREAAPSRVRWGLERRVGLHPGFNVTVRCTRPAAAGPSHCRGLAPVLNRDWLQSHLSLTSRGLGEMTGLASLL
jgi:hypothetical protein